MSVLEYGEAIIAFISVSKGLQISITIIVILGFMVGVASGVLYYWAFRSLDKFNNR